MAISTDEMRGIAVTIAVGALVSILVLCQPVNAQSNSFSVTTPSDFRACPGDNDLIVAVTGQAAESVSLSLEGVSAVGGTPWDVNPTFTPSAGLPPFNSVLDLAVSLASGQTPAAEDVTVTVSALGGGELQSSGILLHMVPCSNFLNVGIVASPISGPPPLSVNFGALTEGGTPPYSYQWIVPSGSSSSVGSTDAATTIVIPQLSTGAGFPVELVVTDSSGLTSWSSSIAINESGSFSISTLSTYASTNVTSATNNDQFGLTGRAIHTGGPVATPFWGWDWSGSHFGVGAPYGLPLGYSVWEETPGLISGWLGPSPCNQGSQTAFGAPLGTHAYDGSGPSNVTLRVSGLPGSGGSEADCPIGFSVSLDTGDSGSCPETVVGCYLFAGSEGSVKVSSPVNLAFVLTHEPVQNLGGALVGSVAGLVVIRTVVKARGKGKAARPPRSVERVPSNPPTLPRAPETSAPRPRSIGPAQRGDQGKE